MKSNSKSSILKVQKYGFVKIIIIIPLLFFQIRYGIIPAWNEINSDFPNYYTSAKLILEGRDVSRIYDDIWFQKNISSYGIIEQGKFSPFPPPDAFIMIPAAYSQPLAAKRAFLIFNIILTSFTAFTIKKNSGLSYVSSYIIILLSGAALSNNLLLGQFYLILITMTLYGYRHFLKNAGYSAGILWGAGSALKYFPVIFLPVILMKKDWKTLFSMIITLVLINAAALIVMGMEVYVQFFQKVLVSHMNGNLSNQSNYAVSFQSWNSFLRNVFVYNMYENISPDFNSLEAFYIVRSAVYFGFITGTLVVLYRLRNNGNIIPYSTVIISLLAFVLSPASASYHLLLLVLPVILLLRLASDMHSFYSIYFVVLYAAIGFSPFFLSKVNKEVAGLFLVYTRLWMIVIFYISSVWFILLHGRKNHNKKYDHLSEIPSAAPFSVDL
ncbi:MAG: glycosyltransferase family 87 protein [Clostridiales bacterium]